MLHGAGAAEGATANLLMSRAVSAARESAQATSRELATDSRGEGGRGREEEEVLLAAGERGEEVDDDEEEEEL